MSGVGPEAWLPFPRVTSPTDSALLPHRVVTRARSGNSRASPFHSRDQTRTGSRADACTEARASTGHKTAPHSGVPPVPAKRLGIRFVRRFCTASASDAVGSASMPPTTPQLEAPHPRSRRRAAPTGVPTCSLHALTSRESSRGIASRGGMPRLELDSPYRPSQGSSLEAYAPRAQEARRPPPRWCTAPAAAWGASPHHPEAPVALSLGD